MRHQIWALTFYFEVGRRITCFTRNAEAFATYVYKPSPGWPCMNKSQRWDVQHLCAVTMPGGHCRLNLCCILSVCKGQSCNIPLEQWLQSSRLGAESCHCPVSLPFAPTSEQPLRCKRPGRSESSAGFFAIRNSRWCQTLLLIGFPSLAWMLRNLLSENLHQLCHGDNSLNTEPTWPEGFPLGGQQQHNLNGWWLSTNSWS